MKRSFSGEKMEKQKSIRLNRIRLAPNGVDLAVYSKKNSNRLNCLYIYILPIYARRPGKDVTIQMNASIDLDNIFPEECFV